MDIDNAGLRSLVTEAVERAMEPIDRRVRQIQDSAIRADENLRQDRERFDRLSQEDRERLAVAIRDDAERLAREVAEKAVKSFMLSLGLDPEKPKDFIQDMMFLQELRKTFSTAKTHAITVIVGIIMLGIATGVWQMVKGGKP